MDDYLSARTVTTPFGLDDCDVPCDGAIAVVVSAAETAGDLARPPVWFLGGPTPSSAMLLTDHR
jgi:hypothetical protein